MDDVKKISELNSYVFQTYFMIYTYELNQTLSNVF